MFLGPLNVISTSFHAHTPIFDSGQNSWPVWPRHFHTKLVLFFFFFFFFFFTIWHLFLGPLNVLSISLHAHLPTSLHAHLPTFYPGQNSFPVWSRCIFVQKWYNVFFFSLNNFAFISWTSKCAIYKISFIRANNWFGSKILTNLTLGYFRTIWPWGICFLELLMRYIQVFMDTRRHLILVKILPTQWSERRSVPGETPIHSFYNPSFKRVSCQRRGSCGESSRFGQGWGIYISDFLLLKNYLFTFHYILL